MTEQQHPMVPPSELLKQWEDDWFEERENADVLLVNAYAAGALAGADAELDACCEWLKTRHWIEPGFADELHAARRPKPQSLKEQALKELDAWTEERNGPGESLLCDGLSVAIIRRALKQLDD